MAHPLHLAQISVRRSQIRVTARHADAVAATVFAKCFVCAGRRQAKRRAMRRPRPKAKAAPARQALQGVMPFSQAFDTIFSSWFAGGTWAMWRTVGKVIFGEPLTAAELKIFQRFTGRILAPTTSMREVWLACGRRAGKDYFVAACVVYLACVKKWTFKPGELGRIMLLAVDSDQSDILFEYVSNLIDSIPEFAAMVEKRSVKLGMRRLLLRNRIEVLIKPADKRRVRGRILVAVIFDEVAHWWNDERHANPDSEVYAAVMPGMLGIPDAKLIAISSTYRRKGLLFETDKRQWGRDTITVNGQTRPNRVLFWKAATWEMRPVESEEHRALFPTFEEELADEKAKDPSSFAAEYGSEYRADMEDYLSVEAVEACVVKGRDTLPYDGKSVHRAFIDTAGGGGQDSLALCISKTTPTGAAVVRLFEKRPPFDAEDAADTVKKILGEYGITMLYGDNFGGDTWKSMFVKRGLGYSTDTRAATVLYRGFAPVVTGRKVEMLDPDVNATVSRCVNQLTGLIKREAGEKITHANGEHDDLANALAGGVLLSIKPPSAATVENETTNTADVARAWEERRAGGGGETAAMRAGRTGVHRVRDATTGRMVDYRDPRGL